MDKREPESKESLWAKIRQDQKYLQDTQEKYIYFLMASDGAAIAYALQQADTVKISGLMIILAIAILCWAISFGFGGIWLLTHARAISSGIDYNKEIDHIMDDPKANENTQGLIDRGLKVIKRSEIRKSEIKSLGSKKASSHKMHLILFMAGVSLFVLWRILELMQRDV